jgi:polar amino acid transport system permease protein
MPGFARGDILYELWIARFAILGGLETTCAVAAAAMAIGLAVALPAALAAAFAPAWLRRLVDLYVVVLRGTPLLVTILFLYFGVGRVWTALPAELAAIVACGLFAGAALTEILRGALRSIPAAQIDAAKAIGLTFGARVSAVILPLAMRRALPSVLNIAVDMVKASTLVSALGVGDLLLSGQQVAMRTVLIAETYVALWIMYLAINTGLTLVGHLIERRFRHVVY